MGGHGSGRKPDPLKRFLETHAPVASTGGEAMILPNHSGVTTHPEFTKYLADYATTSYVDTQDTATLNSALAADLWEVDGSNRTATKDTKDVRINFPGLDYIDFDWSTYTFPTISSNQSIGVVQGSTPVFSFGNITNGSLVPLDMNSNKITELANGTASTDAVNKGQMDTADALKLNNTTDTFTGTLTINGDLDVDTSVLKVDTTNNRVGIGTATPSRLLTVYDPSHAIYQLETGSSSFQQVSFIMKNPSQSWQFINNGALSNAWEIYDITSAKHLFALYPNGSFSIGQSIYSTNYGANALAVQGNLYIPTDNSKLLLGAGQDASIYWDGSDLIINSENITAAYEIHFTNFSNYEFDNDLNIPVDNKKIKMGASNNDIQISSDGTNGLIQTNSGLELKGGDVFFTTSGSGLPFGEIYVEGNTTATTISVQNTWYQFTGFDTNGQSNLTTPDHTNDHITITKAGVYKIDFNVSFSATSGGGKTYEISVQKNNGATVLSNIHVERKMGASGDIGVAAASGFCSCSANDTIELWIRCTDAVTANATLRDVNLNLFQVGG